VCFSSIYLLIAYEFHADRAMLTTGPTSFSDSMLAVGSILLAFNNHPQMLKVSRAMKPASGKRLTHVYCWTNLIITLFYTCVGVGGYLALGNRVPLRLLENNSHDAVFLGVKLTVAVAFALSVPLYVFPFCSIVEWIIKRWALSSVDLGSSVASTDTTCSSRDNCSKHSFPTRIAEKGGLNTYALPILLLCLSISLSYLSEQGFIIFSAFATVAASILTFMFPSIMILTMQDKVKIKRWERVGALICFSVGLGMFLICLSGNIAKRQSTSPHT
jgi:amino acid permease